MARELTERLRAALEAVSAARAASMGITAYANAHGLNARQLHDAIITLRRRGLLPPTERPRPRKGAFVAVRVARTALAEPAMRSTPRTGMVCRLIHAGGIVIECGEWPPAAWLLSLTTGHRDAAS